MSAPKTVHIAPSSKPLPPISNLPTIVSLLAPTSPPQKPSLCQMSARIRALDDNTIFSATLSLLFALFVSALLVVTFFFAFRICRMRDEGEELVGLKARYDFDKRAGPKRGDDEVRTQDDRMSNLQRRCDQQAVTIEQVLVEKTRNEAALVQTIRAMTQDRANLEATVMHTALGNSLCFTTMTQTLLGELRQVKDDKATSDSQARAASTANKQLEIENTGLSSQIKDLQGRLDETQKARARDAIKASELGTEYNKLLAENSRLQGQSDELEEYKSKVAKLEDTVSDCKAKIMKCNTTLANRTSEIAEQRISIANHEATAMQQESTIADQANVISGQRNTIAEREATIIQRESTITDQESEITGQLKLLDGGNATITQQETTIADLESVIARQRKTITDREATISQRESTIADQESKHAEQQKAVEDSKATIAQQETTIANHSTKIMKQDIIIADLEATVIQQKTTVDDYETRIGKQAMTIANLEATITEQRTTLADYETNVSRQQTFIADRETTITQQKVTIDGHEKRLEAQQVRIADYEATIDIERSRLRQIEICAGLPPHAQFVFDRSRKRMDAHGRSQRLAKVATDFERTAHSFVNDALESSSGYLAAAKERRHSVSAGSTRLEVASQLKGPAFTATSPDIRQRLTDKKQRDLEKLSLTKIGFIITIDPDIACKGTAQSNRTFKGSYSIDAYDLPIQAPHGPTALSATLLDDIRDDRIRWADTTKFNAGTYFVCKAIAAKKAAQAALRSRTQSKFNHILETLTPLGKFMERHDLNKARGSGPSLIDRLGKLAGQSKDEKLMKLIGELEECNEQIQRETERKIEQMVRDLSKWLLDFQDTEVSNKQDNGDRAIDQFQSRQSKKELGHEASSHDQEPKPDRGAGSATNSALNNGWSMSSNTESISSEDTTSDMAAKQPPREEPIQRDARAVQNQGKSRTHTVAEQGTFAESQADDSQPQLEGPQAKKKTRRKMKTAKNTAQPTQDDIGTVGNGQQGVDIVGRTTGLGASRFAQSAVDERPVVGPQAPAASVRSGLQSSKFATSAVADRPVIVPQAPAASVRSGLQSSKFATSEVGNPETAIRPSASAIQTARQATSSQAWTRGKTSSPIDAPTGPRAMKPENERAQHTAADHTWPTS
ncbi:hypothetical protein LTR70_009008 [Exophiala xenobiotica]|uniref:Uncharacterized protein n=1 Tax=Lithohypha guttulata TaxID=1690604 RepID=A0ABR0JZF6_9EURO|nr:hypothetical protein LTR24_008774 [Lithohypha guttulata]KAK5311114.1 hypothetical protein LTR70_009008 [Exophiala xenobiotica]